MEHVVSDSGPNDTGRTLMEQRSDYRLLVYQEYLRRCRFASPLALLINSS